MIPFLNKSNRHLQIGLPDFFCMVSHNFDFGLKMKFCFSQLLPIPNSLCFPARHSTSMFIKSPHISPESFSCTCNTSSSSSFGCTRSPSTRSRLYQIPQHQIQTLPDPPAPDTDPTRSPSTSLPAQRVTSCQSGVC